MVDSGLFAQGTGLCLSYSRGGSQLMRLTAGFGEYQTAVNRVTTIHALKSGRKFRALYCGALWTKDDKGTLWNESSRDVLRTEYIYVAHISE